MQEPFIADDSRYLRRAQWILLVFLIGVAVGSHIIEKRAQGLSTSPSSYDSK